MRIGHLIFAELVQATARVDVYRFTVGDNTAGQIVDVQQILEQIVEVIKVILREQCQRVLFSFDSVWDSPLSHARVGVF